MKEDKEYAKALNEINKEERIIEQKTFWCIVSYIGATPFYYAGYYGKHKATGDLLRPALTNDFNNALKLNSKEEAERLLPYLKTDWKAEEHGYI